MHDHLPLVGMRYRFESPWITIDDDLFLQPFLDLIICVDTLLVRRYMRVTRAYDYDFLHSL